MTPSAAARFSLSAAEFKECSEHYFGHRWTWKRYGEVRKKTEKYVLLLGTAIFIIGSRSL